MTKDTIKTEELAETSKTAKTAKKAAAPKVAKEKSTTDLAAKNTVTKAKAAPKAAKSAKTKTSSTGTVKITLVKSLIGRLEAHKASARGLGLSRIRQTVEVADTVENRGMINAIGYLLKCEG